MDRQSLQKQAEECALYIEESSSIVILSGAGLSTSAGIPDFRGPQGIYKKMDFKDPEKIFELTFFLEKPSFFYNFYREFLKELSGIRPTYTHSFIAALEQQGKVSGVITQNIDSLHQKAGSQKVYEIHGGIQDASCLSCGKHYNLEEMAIKTGTEEVPQCSNCKGTIKPDIVFFGEGVKHLDIIQDLVKEADLFFVLGSSLTVTPAAFLPGMTPGKVVVVNMGSLSRAYLPPQKITLHVEAKLDTFFCMVAKKLQHTGLYLGTNFPPPCGTE